MKHQKEPDLSVGLCRHSLATNYIISVQMWYFDGNNAARFESIVAKYKIIIFQSAFACRPTDLLSFELQEHLHVCK